MAIVKRVSIVSVLVLLWSVLVHSGVLVVWLVTFRGHESFVGYDVICATVLACSLLASAGELAVAEVAWFRGLLVVRLVCAIALIALFDADLFVSTLLLSVLVGEIISYEDFPHSLWLCGALLTLVVVLFPVPPEGDRLWYRTVLPVVASIPLAVAGSFSLRYRRQMIGLLRDVERLDHAVVELSDASKHYLRQANVASERSVKEERDRITRDLHDSIGYTLTNLIMMMHSAKALANVDTEKLRRTLDTACEQATEGLSEVRRALYHLRGQGSGSVSGIVAIDRMVKTFGTAAAVQVEVHYGNSPMSFGAEVDDIVYHFVEEGLTNSFRHGRADLVRLSLWVDHDMLTITLWDNGIGSALIDEGIGLIGMRERLGAVGGTLEIGGVQNGFQIRSEIPL